MERTWLAFHCWLYTLYIIVYVTNKKNLDLLSSGIVKQLGPLSSNVRDRVRNLGVVFDPTLSFDKQISTVLKSSFFQLRSIARIKKMLSMKDLQTVIHAFITSRLDYCNSLYLGLPKSSLNRLQLVQNAAARLLTGTKKREHITPVLASLHSRFSSVLILRFCSLFLKLYMVVLPSIFVISSFHIPPLDLFGRLVNFFSMSLVHILKLKVTVLLLWQHLGSGTVVPST